jgi:hypothetical protein
MREAEGGKREGRVDAVKGVCCRERESRFLPEILMEALSRDGCRWGFAYSRHGRASSPIPAQPDLSISMEQQHSLPQSISQCHVA